MSNNLYTYDDKLVVKNIKTTGDKHGKSTSVNILMFMTWSN